MNSTLASASAAVGDDAICEDEKEMGAHVVQHVDQPAKAVVLVSLVGGGGGGAGAARRPKGALGHRVCTRCCLFPDASS
jgi:hypothetical protein